MRARDPASIPRATALRPRMYPTTPLMRARIAGIQAQLLDELHQIDAEVQDLVERRLEVVAELRLCRDGLGPIGIPGKRQPLPRDIDAEPEGTVEIAGPDLTQAVNAMLQAAGRPVSLSEMHRMLLAHGLRPAGRPSQAISNALRPGVARGRVVRLDRGIYLAAGTLDTNDGS
jgi:hypothetical protein